jgi:hypothetical protein
LRVSTSASDSAPTARVVVLVSPKSAMRFQSSAKKLPLLFSTPKSAGS